MKNIWWFENNCACVSRDMTPDWSPPNNFICLCFYSAVDQSQASRRGHVTCCGPMGGRGSWLPRPPTPASTHQTPNADWHGLTPLLADLGLTTAERGSHVHMRSPPEELHLASRLVLFLGDFSCLSWASITCNWAEILICWSYALLQ